MKKSVEVIIKEKQTLNPTKRIKKVALGYALNYLIPNKIAEISSKGKIKHLNMIYDIISKKENQIYYNYLKIKYDIESINTIHIRRKCSQNMQIFGSIAENDIINKILSLTGTEIEKKQINLQPIKNIGIYKLHLTFDENLNTEIELHILPNIT